MKYNDQNNRDNTGVNHNITPISAQQLWNQFCRFDLWDPCPEADIVIRNATRVRVESGESERVRESCQSAGD